MMRPNRPAQFDPGPTLKPSGELLDWLNQPVRLASGRRRRLRLPVVVRFQDTYRLAYQDAFIGASERELDAESIFLHLDDSGMSISLQSILIDLCPKTSTVCAVWLEGYWGSLLPGLPGLEVERAEGAAVLWPFAVLDVKGLIQDQPGQDEVVRVFYETDRPLAQSSD